MATGVSQVFPQPFGRYFLTSKVAMGGMAEIFRAKSIGAEGFEKVVAIKRILPHFTEDEGFVTMFKDEAKVAAQLTHANVVQVFDFDEVDELFYIAMEFVEGHDLKRVLDMGVKNGKPLSIAQSVYILIEAAQGLHYAHTRVVDGQPLNIIHRDVSPHNVMVSFNGEVKIMDFGIAKAASRSTKTRVGTVKGKCAYMSPEQARGKNLDPRSDLFALGVTLWEMLTGKRLFVGESDFETLNNVLKAEVPPPSELNPDVPKDLEAIVLRSLARERDERQGDCGMFATELRRWFYANVPDPDAVNLKGYMHDLFADQIEKLKTDVAAEAQMMDAIRKGQSGQRKAVTGSQPAMAAGDDERTMALDSSALAAPGDADRTMALPDAAAMLSGMRPASGPNASRTMAAVEPPKKSNVGLIVGGVVALAVVVGVGMVMMGGEKPKAANVGAPPAAPVKVLLTIKAAGAKQISVLGGEMVCTNKDECTYKADKGVEISVLAKDGDRQQMEKITPESDGQVLEIKLPAAEKKVEAVAAAATTILAIEVVPANADVTIAGQHVPVAGGIAKLPTAKLGDTLKVEVKAEGHKPMVKDVLVATPTVQKEVFKLESEKKADAPAAAAREGGAAGEGDEGKAAAAGPGHVKVTATPWAKVSVKGKAYGTTPIDFDLPAGKHTVTLTKGDVTKSKSVVVKPGKTATVDEDMSGE
jgi:hypothetical protein